MASQLEILIEEAIERFTHFNEYSDCYPSAEVACEALEILNNIKKILREEKV